ncbi:MAG: protein TolA [Bradyrhizobiaceae bacterium]|nr:MAG: protein TolA [Bradyrhizobiaceae bacterium]
MKIDKTVVASVALHVLVIGWGLVSFSSKAFDTMPEDSVPVDIISADQFAKAMAGMKTGKKENPKPLVEKVADAKPLPDDTVGKIDDKKPPVVTDTSPPPTPKVEEKPVEKKPDPPKPVVEEKPKDEPKQAEKKEEPQKVDPIAEALKKEQTKKPKPPKPQVAAAPPKPAEPKRERVFDESKIAALLDKRDPSRASITGAQLNSQASLGTSTGHAADNSATWGAMFKSQVERCWKKPYGGVEAQQIETSFTIKLRQDGTLESMPVPIAGKNTPYARVYQESAMRAIIECQPYKLPAAFFDEWKFFEPVFTEKYS